MRPTLGSCGHTDEMVAARSHLMVAIFYGLALAALSGALFGEAVMLLWHRASVRVHLERAKGQS